ncbi:MAG TPA: TonB-dependent receptor [Gemmatimonadaceae bacterium]|nr:TonB-dependent receptor [Gemmatimonadaceae bacterium]
MTAQQPAQPAAGGTISGSVLDAVTAAPLAHATVTLTSADGFGVLVDARASSFALARTTTTSADGTYRFGELPIGAYRLRFQRLGYESAIVDVRLGENGTSPLSIGLAVLPVRLRPVEIRARDAGQSPNAQPRSVDSDARLAAARARQHEFLSTDARELTAADVAESATLGGSDVLRSLQRLPGVTQLDDWSARLWVRGNRWDHDRVYYDGLPLFDPLGVLGRTAGVSAVAIGGAFLHPGVRPVSLGGEGATQIDLRSRPALGDGRWHGSAEVSQFDANAAIETGRADGSAGLIATAQHSFGHWLPYDGFFSEALRGRSYQDAGASARGDIELGGGARIETSGLYTRDARTLRTVLDSDGTNQEWSNASGRVALSAPIGPFATSHTFGISRYASHVDRWTVQPPTIAGGSVTNIVPAPVKTNVEYVMFGGRIAPRAPARNVTTVGYDVIAQRSSFTGTNETPVWGDPYRPFMSRRGSLSYGSAWVDARTELGTRVTLENGLRLDVGAARGLDAVRPAGSAQALFALSQDTRVSVGVSRVHQYLQAVELPAVAQNQTLPGSWLTSGGDVPVMSVDNAMAGLEQWVQHGVLLAANAYVRRTTGTTADDPTPGALIRRPLFVEATESAQGLELSARKLIGRATGLVAYSYGHATMRARGLSFPAPADRTHALDAALSVHLGGFNVGGAYTLTSGAPYTRTVLGAAAGQSSATGSIAVREAPNAHRLPSYSSLDVSMDYTRLIKGVALIGFAGAQNVLGRSNATWYEISGYCDDGQSQPVASPRCRGNDLLEAPVKLTPTIGLRLVVR